MQANKAWRKAWWKHHSLYFPFLGTNRAKCGRAFAFGLTKIVSSGSNTTSLHKLPWDLLLSLPPPISLVSLGQSLPMTLPLLPPILGY